MCYDEAAAKQQDRAVEEDLEALIFAQMQTRNSDIPGKRDCGACEQNQDAGDVFRASLTPSGLIVVWDHPRPPREK
jgi:hypothetical protein